MCVWHRHSGRGDTESPKDLKPVPASRSPSPLVTPTGGLWKLPGLRKLGWGWGTARERERVGWTSIRGFATPCEEGGGPVWRPCFGETSDQPPREARPSPPPLPRARRGGGLAGHPAGRGGSSLPGWRLAPLQRSRTCPFRVTGAGQPRVALGSESQLPPPSLSAQGRSQNFTPRILLRKMG